MSKKHFFLFDFLLPLAGIALIGRFLAQRFDGALFHSVDTLRAFGIGFWFAHSDLRATLWDYSWIVFALFPAALWLVWCRINLEYDYVQRGRKLDRPIFKFFQALVGWIEGTAGQGPGDRRSGGQGFAGHLPGPELEKRLAQSHDHIHRLEAELAALRSDSRGEWPDDVMPPARRHQG
jgi:hypothetical protein